MIHTLGLKCCHEVLRVELVTWCFPGVEGRLVKLDKVLVMVDANRIGHLKQELKEDVGIFDVKPHIACWVYTIIAQVYCRTIGAGFSENRWRKVKKLAGHECRGEIS